MSDYRVFSTPGKALLAGGYLVLDPQYESFVTALSSRMHSCSRKVPRKSSESITISVSSPQFLNGNWKYEIRNEENYLILKDQNGGRNPFVESTINVVYSYVNPNPEFENDIEVVIFSDSGYHSQVDSKLKSSTNGNRTFNYHEKEITKVAKTGLGSSAGLVTSLTTGLLSSFLKNFDPKDPDTLQKIHNLAQVAHCHAQGKIGSGFDVASATFGSIVYRRFKPEVISSLIENLGGASIADNHSSIKNVVDSEWDMTHDKCSLPKGIKLLMGDIVGGSETPKLVSKVVDWRAANPEQSLKLFSDLDSSNMSLVSSLNRLQELSINDPKTYDELLKYLVSHSNQQIDSLIQLSATLKIKLDPLLQVIDAIKSIRHNLRLLTRYTGAEIEPISQTVLLNNTNTLKGVLGGVIPGAGGYDAVCLLVAEDAIESILKETNGTATNGRELNPVDTKLLQNVSWLDLGEQSEGVLEENPADFEGLL